MQTQDDFDWVKHRHLSDETYENARFTGNLELTKSHNTLQDGDLEIAFAVELAQVYLQTTPRGKALDVACGCGYMTDCLLTSGFDSIGFDISKEAIALAQENYPDISFFCGDGTKPKDYFSKPQFDLIHIREFHPFTRVDNFDFQIEIINQYLDVLNDNGLIVICQSRRGDYGNLDMERVKRYFINTGVMIAGPLYFFPHKHLGISVQSKIANKCLSLLTKMYATVRRRYPVEYFLIYKKA